MQANRSGHARAVLSEVQTRHDDIKKIEKTILVSENGPVSFLINDANSTIK